jgi:hypothetical protein
LVFSKLTGWIGEAREGEDLKGRQLKKTEGGGRARRRKGFR